MSIQGHKDRALLRRGIHVQESLKRRDVLIENHLLRRSLNEEDVTPKEEDPHELVKLHALCGEETGKGITDSVYCTLVEILESLDLIPRDETYKAINVIYQFFKSPLKKDNRSLFRKTIKAVLKNENPEHALRIIASFLVNPEFDRDDAKRALADFIREEGSVPEAALEGFLKQARFKEYSRYEESFKGDNFDLVRGSLRSGDTGFDDTVPNIINGVHNGRIHFESAVQGLANSILNSRLEDVINKADLVCKNDLKVGDEIIIPKGGKIEVKKMDYDLDSYFSEFFAIYKTRLPDEFRTVEFRETYNDLIDAIYEYLLQHGQKYLDGVMSGIEGIMYDGNLIIPKENIELYWSNKGQRGCDERRVAIRFRLINPEIQAYIYNGYTHSTELRPQEVSVEVRPRVICN